MSPGEIVMRRILLVGILSWCQLHASSFGQTLFFDDFENGVSRNTSGGIWYGYDNGFFGDPQWLESDSSHNHTPGGARSARAYEADPWVYNSFADFGATDQGLRATVYLYEDMNYVPPYLDQPTWKQPYIEVRSMFTLFGDSAEGPSEVDPASDYLQIRLIPDVNRPPDPAPAFYTYGIRTKYLDDNALRIIDTGIPRKDSDWLKLTIEVDSVASGGEVRFFLDDVLVGMSQRTGADFRWVMMGATGPTYENYWYDDISVVEIHGDYNGDGATNAADYVLWRKVAPNSLDAFTTWKRGFGFGDSGPALVSVPEPAYLSVLAIFLWVMPRRARRLEFDCLALVAVIGYGQATSTARQAISRRPRQPGWLMRQRVRFWACLRQTLIRAFASYCGNRCSSFVRPS
jgi:hypothetical protein